MAKKIDLSVKDVDKFVNIGDRIPILNMAMMLDGELYQNLCKHSRDPKFSIMVDESYDQLPLSERHKYDLKIYKMLYPLLLSRNFEKEEDGMSYIQLMPEYDEEIRSIFANIPIDTRINLSFSELQKLEKAFTLPGFEYTVPCDLLVESNIPFSNTEIVFTNADGKQGVFTVIILTTTSKKLFGIIHVLFPDGSGVCQVFDKFAGIDQLCLVTGVGCYGKSINCSERDIWFSISYLLRVWYLIQLGSIHPAGYDSMQKVTKVKDRRKTIAGCSVSKIVRNVYERTFKWDSEKESSFQYCPGHYANDVWIDSKWESKVDSDFVNIVEKNKEFYKIKHLADKLKDIEFSSDIISKLCS